MIGWVAAASGAPRYLIGGSQLPGGAPHDVIGGSVCQDTLFFDTIILWLLSSLVV